MSSTLANSIERRPIFLSRSMATVALRCSPFYHACQLSKNRLEAPVGYGVIAPVFRRTLSAIRTHVNLGLSPTHRAPP